MEAAVKAQFHLTNMYTFCVGLYIENSLIFFHRFLYVDVAVHLNATYFSSAPNSDLETTSGVPADTMRSEEATLLVQKEDLELISW